VREDHAGTLRATLVGLINGSFLRAVISVSPVIFGMLNIIKFAHGALYMMGRSARISCSTVLASITGTRSSSPDRGGHFRHVAGAHAAAMADGARSPLGLLLTFGVALIIQGVFQNYSVHRACLTPSRSTQGGMNLASCSCRSIAAGWWCSRW